MQIFAAGALCVWFYGVQGKNGSDTGAERRNFLHHDVGKMVPLIDLHRFYHLQGKTEDTAIIICLKKNERSTVS